MGNSIDEAVVLLVAADLTDQEDRVQDEPGGDGTKKITPRKTLRPSSQFRMIQPKPTATAAAARNTPNDRKKKTAFRRLVMRIPQFYSGVGRSLFKEI